MRWRMESPCRNCPFHEEGPGRELRDSLADGRWEGIVEVLWGDGHFHCHETVHVDDRWSDEDGEEPEYQDAHPVPKGALLCAGALRWQEENLGYWGQLARVMDRVAHSNREEGKT